MGFRRIRPELNPKTCKNHGVFAESARSRTPELRKNEKTPKTEPQNSETHLKAAKNQANISIKTHMRRPCNNLA